MNINIENLSFYYGETEILRDISYTVPQGRFVGIIGPNGSGKTTLVKLLSRLLTPTAGRILLGDRPLADFTQNSLARMIAVVHQETGTEYQFTVEEVVLMGRMPYLRRFQSESSADYEIVNRSLAITGCTELRRRKITELSGGEKQRVMIARALAQQPQILLLDEPTSHLDIGYQQEILELVKNLTTEGITVVAVLHDLNLAAYFCHELLLLHEGRIKACGQAAAVLITEKIEEVYGIRVLVTPHPVFGTPQVSLLPGTRERGALRKTRHVHIIAGGGSGGELMRDLVQVGYYVTAGVLNIGDSDWEAARALGLPVISEAPFSGISEERHRDNLNIMNNSRAVVLAEIPLGHGNLLNLQAALTAAKEGKKVFILEENPGRERDFTGGRGAELLGKIREAAVICRDKTELYGKLAMIEGLAGTNTVFEESSR